MIPPNLSVNINKNIATENFSENSLDITTVDFSVKKIFSKSNCLHLETPINFPINNDFNQTKLNDINKISCSCNIPENVEIYVAKYQKAKISQIRGKILEI